MCIHLILGPIFSGKTTELLRLGERHQLAGRNVVYVKHRLECKRTPGSNLQTHDGRIGGGKMVLVAERMAEVFWQLSKLCSSWAHTICIDDGHLFKDLRLACQTLATLHAKHVIIAALNGDTGLQMFPSIIAVLPIACDVQMLTAVCSSCGANKAAYTEMLGPTVAIAEVGLVVGYVVG